MFTTRTDIPKDHVGRINATSGIVLEGVSKDYGTGVLAVEPVDLHIERGEFFSLLGSSGSGKTTTLKMLSGLEYATSGTITLEGVDITRMPANKRDVHTVFQNYALFPHMSVAKNVAYGLEGRHMDRAEIAKRVAGMLESVDLKGHEDDLPSALSGGMQQRVALARALVLEPKALLLDEPLGALDMKLRHHMQEVLKSIHDEVGITFVYVTHDQEEAFSMSDRIGVMTQGRLVQVSTPEDLYRHPESAFVADFVGASNMLTGTIEAVRDSAKGSYQVRFHEIGRTAVVSGVKGLAPGASVCGVVRPQNVAVSPVFSSSAARTAATLSIDMDVCDRVFLGSHTKVSLEAVDFHMVAHPSQRFPHAFTSARATVSWEARDMWVVPA